MYNPRVISKLRISNVALFILIVSLSSTISFFNHSSEGVYIPMQTSETDWELLDSDYPDAVFHDVTFLNSTHGWIAGQETGAFDSNPVLLHTENGGTSWQLQYNNDTDWISTIDVLNDQTVWVNGDGSLFYSLDGGATWNESEVPEAHSWMTTVKFINMTHGWTATNGILYHTGDSGQSWSVVDGFTYDDNPRMIQCLSSFDIWAIGSGGIYHSLDGGVTWEQVSNRGGWSLSFVNEYEGWAIGDNRLAHTTDGRTWEELIVPMRYPAYRLTGPYCTDILFIDEDNGWIVGSEIPVMYTPDGGVNWYHQSVPVEVNRRIMAVDFINQTHGWAVGSGGIIMRTITGNSLGYRLWYGLTDPLFLSIVAVVVVGVITSSVGIFLIRRRYRRGTGMKIKPPQPEI